MKDWTPIRDLHTSVELSRLTTTTDRLDRYIHGVDIPAHTSLTVATVVGFITGYLVAMFLR